MDEDNVYFDRLCGTDFRTLASGRLYSIDEKLLKLKLYGDVRVCATADVDLVGSTAEVIMVR